MPNKNKHTTSISIGVSGLGKNKNSSEMYSTAYSGNTGFTLGFPQKNFSISAGNTFNMSDKNVSATTTLGGSKDFEGKNGVSGEIHGSYGRTYGAKQGDIFSLGGSYSMPGKMISLDGSHLSSNLGNSDELSFNSAVGTNPKIYLGADYSHQGGIPNVPASFDFSSSLGLGYKFGQHGIRGTITPSIGSTSPLGVKGKLSYFGPSSTSLGISYNTQPRAIAVNGSRDFGRGWSGNFYTSLPLTPQGAPFWLLGVTKTF